MEEMEQQPAQAGAQPAGGGDQGGQLMEGVAVIGDGLMKIGQGFQEAGAPPQLLEPLNAAVTAFQHFQELLAGGGAQPEAQQGTVDQGAGGNPNAQPV